MEKACQENQIRFYHPSPILCTDNAAMIGAAAYYEYKKASRHGWDLNAGAESEIRGEIDHEIYSYRSGSRTGKTDAQ